MFRKLFILPALAIAVSAAIPAATLQQLSMDQMTELATSVVRARVTGSSAAISKASGTATIYTHYKLEVSEIWKGAPVTEVTMPGGTVNGQQQSFPGVPELRVGAEYVLFLWKSPTTGIIHTIGLTQGVFEVTKQADGAPLASRKQSGELMVDASGHRVSDQAVSLGVDEMKSRVHRSPGAIQ